MGICNEITKNKYETPKKSYTAQEYNETPKKSYTAQEDNKIPENKVKINMEAPQPVSFKNDNIKNINNIIKIKLKIEKDDVNKLTKILYNINSQRDDCDLKELNESNTELFINEKKYDYKSFFIPEKEGIYEIQLNIKILMKNCCCLFFGLKNLQSLDLSSFNTQNVTNMSYMFYKCNNLQSLDLSSFNTQKVTNMSYMFYECKYLQNLDLSSFNTQNVTSMSDMFYKCNNLQNLDLSSFNTQNVTSMIDMFTFSGLNRVVVNVQDSQLISIAKGYSINILYA